MTTSQPFSFASTTSVAITSSASTPGTAMHGQPRPSTIFEKYSIWTGSSSGVSLRLALYSAYISARNVRLPLLSSNTTAIRLGALSSSSRISMRENT